MYNMTTIQACGNFLWFCVHSTL